MKNLIIIFIASFLLISCISNFIARHQKVPEFNFESVVKVKVEDFAAKNKFVIDRPDELAKIINAFKDTTNYFLNDRVKEVVIDKKFLLTIINDVDTLNLSVLPSEDFKEKILFEYSEKGVTDSDVPFIDFQLFYFDKSILELLEK